MLTNCSKLLVTLITIKVELLHLFLLLHKRLCNCIYNQAVRSYAKIGNRIIYERKNIVASENTLNNYLPPQNIEAERAVLGAILLNNSAIATALEYLQPEDFYKHAHRILFQTMVELNDKDQPLDTVTLLNTLKSNNQLEDVGGATIISEIASVVPSAANIAYYAKIVADKATARRLIAVATDIITQTNEGGMEIADILDDAERSIMGVSSNRNSGGFRRIDEVLDKTVDEINRLATQGNEITGLPTGYTGFDRLTSGLQPDNLIILAARPAVGKTAFALNMAQNIATSRETTVALFSLEMSAESLVSRMICAEGTIRADHLRNGSLDEDEYRKLMMAVGSLSRASIYIDDTPGIKMSQIRAKCLRLAKERQKDKPLGLVVIDYLQLIEGSNKESRQQEVSEISRQLKKLAKEINVPVIALSQLSRRVESREDKRPVLSDIRESGSIEQDADIVAFLYREDYYESTNLTPKADENSDNQQPFQNTDSNQADEVPSTVELIIEKNRAGARGTVNLAFSKQYNKFTNIANFEAPDQ